MDNLMGQKSCGEEVDVLSILPVVAINTLWYIIAGERHELGDKKFVHLTQTVLRFFRISEIDSPVALYKFLQHVPIVNRSFREQQKCGVELCDFVEVSESKYVFTNFYQILL